MNDAKSYLHISPSNQPANSKISYKSGIPIINFTIGEQDKYLLGRTIRINGKLSVKKGTPANPVDIVVGDGIALDPHLGVMSVIDMITVSSKRTTATMEQIRHYGRFLSSFQNMTNGPNDFLGHFSGMFGSVGDLKQSVIQTTATTGTEEYELAFSLPLLCGLFTGADPIPLSANWGVQGVQISINLAPDSNVLYTTAKDANGDPIADPNAFYELSDVHLTCEVAEANGNETPGGTFMYNTISSFYDVVSASYSTINFNLGLSRVLGVWVNFIKGSSVNNYAENGFSIFPLQNVDGTPAQITKLSFLRGGTKYPLQYEIESGDSRLIAPMLLRTYIDAISTFTKLDRTCICTENTNNLNLDTSNVFMDVNGGAVFGIGCPYDQISDVGVDFSQQQIGFVVESNLNSIGQPYGAYMFCHAKSALQFGSGGIQVHH